MTNYFLDNSNFCRWPITGLILFIVLKPFLSLAMMKEGGKATLVIPSELAYGDAGTGDVIGPGATLKFEVELFKVE